MGAGGTESLYDSNSTENGTHQDSDKNNNSSNGDDRDIEGNGNININADRRTPKKCILHC